MTVTPYRPALQALLVTADNEHADEQKVAGRLLAGYLAELAP